MCLFVFVFFFFENRLGIVFSYINTEYVVSFCDVIRRRVLIVRDVGLAEISPRCRARHCSFENLTWCRNLLFRSAESAIR